ncbi:nucleotide exchange factor GrpE [Bacteroides uniformis]
MSVRSEIANKVSELSRENLTLRNQLEEFEKSQDKRIDEIFCDFLTVLDTFERAEQTIKERELDKDETTKKAINRLLNAKKKALGVLEKFNVQKIEFENNKSIEELCEVADTEPDPGRETGDIVSIEKQGYTRHGHLIRPAEVIIVKN